MQSYYAKKKTRRKSKSNKNKHQWNEKAETPEKWSRSLVQQKMC
jgi:hypothetical protein